MQPPQKKEIPEAKKKNHGIIVTQSFSLMAVVDLYSSWQSLGTTVLYYKAYSEENKESLQEELTKRTEEGNS